MIKIKVPIYDKSIYIYTEGEGEQAIAKMNKFYGKNDERVGRLENAVGISIGNVLYIGDNSINTLAHELSHCIDDLVELVEIKDEEAKAYLFGYVFEQVCTKLHIVWEKK